ncbi:hypothetical protein HOT42_gp24 [Microbacterium phage Metamorphoo]|uniref:Uncharacterized protein n=1 Tax=Microbacterium phage Metamorphoo TaxID=2201437 RepID=A0A2Z4Q625_9CAUD|nr:hypothetical protein HOT42_gp24 [Microbacterium phage Metamorphoo]AWY05375.1 hypothetical protein SEA_METAMORPHOO_24 [Microbacterium phage Metamorphoo]
MSNAYTEHQDNYMDIDEARVAASTARSRDFASEISAATLIREHDRFPESAFPFSGDHLGVFSHRDTTPQGDPGDEVRRERILNSDIDLWVMVAA